MNEVASLTVVAQDEDEFDGLLARAAALFGSVAKFERTNGGRTMTYEAMVLRRFDGNLDNLTVTLDFDATALKILGVDLDGRAALQAADAATKH